MAGSSNTPFLGVCVEFTHLSEDVPQGYALSLSDRDLPAVIGMGYVGMSDINLYLFRRFNITASILLQYLVHYR